MSTSDNATAHLWDAATGRLIGRPLAHGVYDDGMGGLRSVFAVAFRPDGKVVATAGQDQTARLWDTATAQPIGQLMRHQGTVFGVTFSPDGRVVATRSQDGTARLWDAATGRPLGPPLRLGPVNGLAFRPDGKVLATAAADGTARLWDVATAQPLCPPLRHRGAAFDVAFSPDGAVLATADAKEMAYLWDMPAPVDGDVRRVVLWTQLLTEMELDQSDAVNQLGHDDWHARRREIEAIGGPLDPARPGPRQYRADLARSLLELGQAQARSPQNEGSALANLERARDLLEALVAESPGDAKDWDVLARACEQLGLMQGQVGRPAEALASLERARGLRESLAHDTAGDRPSAAALARTYHSLGVVQGRAGRPAEALASFERARALREGLVGDHPQELPGRRHLGQTWRNIGVALAALGRVSGALAAHEQAVEIQRLVFEADPHVPGHRQDLALCYGGLAQVQRTSGRPADLAATAARRRALWPADPVAFYHEARLLAACVPLVGGGTTSPGAEVQAERRTYADRAMAALRSAAENGLKVVFTAADFEAVRKEPDLDPLRSRADFRAWSMDLIFPDWPFASDTPR